MDFTKEQMDFAIQIENEVLAHKMHVKEKAEYLKKCWYCGWLEDLFIDFYEFVEAVSAAEYKLLYNK